MHTPLWRAGILAAAASLAAFLAGCDLLTFAKVMVVDLHEKTVTNGEISVYKPMGYVADVAKDGKIEISMAETMNYFSAQPVVNQAEFDTLAGEELRLRHDDPGYREDGIVRVTKVGHLVGTGIMFTQKDEKHREYPYKLVFISSGSRRWLIEAKSGGGKLQQGWQNMLDSLVETGPNQVPVPTATSGRGTS